MQFVYGDDGMDPVTMEGKGASALDFDKVLGKVCVCLCVCVRGVCTVFWGACVWCMVCLRVCVCLCVSVHVCACMCMHAILIVRASWG